MMDFIIAEKKIYKILKSKFSIFEGSNDFSTVSRIFSEYTLNEPKETIHNGQKVYEIKGICKVMQTAQYIPYEEGEEEEEEIDFENHYFLFRFDEDLNEREYLIDYEKYIDLVQENLELIKKGDFNALLNRGWTQEWLDTVQKLNIFELITSEGEINGLSFRENLAQYIKNHGIPPPL